MSHTEALSPLPIYHPSPFILLSSPTHTNAHTYQRMLLHTHTHTHTQRYTRAHARTHARAHTHTHIHARTHTNTHTHIARARANDELPRMQKLRIPLMGPHGYQRFPLSKPVVGQNIALHAEPAGRTCTYLVSAFRIHSTSFFPKLLTRGGVPRTQK